MLHQSESQSAIKELIENAKKAGMQVSEFTREMLETTNDNIVLAKTAQKRYADIEHLGVLIF